MKKLWLLFKGQLAWLFSSKKVNKDIWVFSSRNNIDFNYNSKYLFLYVKEHMKQIRPLYVVNDKGRREQLQKEYGEEYFIETLNIRFFGKKKKEWLTHALDNV